MRTNSGAHVFLTANHAVKVAAGGKVRRRLHDQAEYMRHIGPELTPHVDFHVPGGYVMEKCWPYRASKPEQYVADVVPVLEQIWRRPTVRGTSHDLGAHYRYVMERVRQCMPTYETRVSHLIQSLDLASCRPCLVHGDPTYENVMKRPGSILLADPLPPQPYMPELAAVDVGKVLQSLLGYELVERTWSIAAWQVDSERATQMVSEALNRPEYDREVRAAAWFAFAHCVRLLPYKREEVRPHYVKLAERAWGLAAWKQMTW